MSARENDGEPCRICGRSALAHPSGACRTCRRGKPPTWVARHEARAKPAGRILTEDERAPFQPKGWRDRSHESWKRRAPETG